MTKKAFVLFRCLLSVVSCRGEGNFRSEERNTRQKKLLFYFVFRCPLLCFCFEPVRNALKSDHRTKIILNYDFDLRTGFN